ncbi:Hsp33 family molecular chaperone HslO [uncultured Umboniibacter sp.]|uniref:Hsp33 family molecular chaperone HslO n=1 Tax=uncultured Umboniibacter sp. TaxID=1798917 RepID=UPI002623E108|nr:Hsp33 family molecular chaperone HslO [uncultured Umboniibacter sp.]
MSTQDQIQRFLFDEADIRGQFVQIDDALNAALKSHSYPEPIKALLAEFLCATAILSTTLKFEGVVTLQVRSTGPLKTIMAECSNHTDLRCIAQYDEAADPAVFEQPLSQLLGDSALTITIDPTVGNRYQGIVAFEKEDLAGALADYFEQSEQLRTKYWMHYGNNRAAALMLQILPGENVLPKDDNDTFFDQLSAFGDTVTKDEATQLEAPELLHRLFHEEAVSIFDPREVRFKCSCSFEKMARALSSVPRAEIAQAIDEEGGAIDVDCQFCRERYKFDRSSLNFVYEMIEKPLH